MIFVQQDLWTLLGIVVALVVGITCHEFSHALVADYLGDHRPRAMGRVSLNPVRHIDPLGAIFFLAAGFGWGRPVMVNGAAMRGGRRAMAWVAAAGPIANLVVAILFAVIFRALALTGGDRSDAARLIFVIVELNVTLAFFNLLPIPPLDGYNFALALVPFRVSLQMQRWAQYGLIILLGLVILSRLAPGASPLDWLFTAAAATSGVLIGA